MTSFIELSKQDFMRYVPAMSYDNAVAALSMYNNGRSTISFAASLISHWQTKLKSKSNVRQQ